MASVLPWKANESCFFCSRGQPCFAWNSEYAYVCLVCRDTNTADGSPLMASPPIFSLDNVNVHASTLTRLMSVLISRLGMEFNWLLSVHQLAVASRLWFTQLPWRYPPSDILLDTFSYTCNPGTTNNYEDAVGRLFVRGSSVVVRGVCGACQSGCFADHTPDCDKEDAKISSLFLVSWRSSVIGLLLTSIINLLSGLRSSSLALLGSTLGWLIYRLKRERGCLRFPSL